MFQQFSNTEIITLLLLAARWTVVLSLIAILGGALLALSITTLRALSIPALENTIKFASYIVQSVPLLMLLFLSFFGLPLVGIETSAWGAAAFALILFTGTYLGEIWTSAIRAVLKGQWEAARSVGLPFLACFRFVIIPQAVRLALPPSVGFLVQVVKGTALASIIGFTDVTKAGTALNNVVFRPFFIFTIVALIYFCLCFPISLYARKLEMRMKQAH